MSTSSPSSSGNRPADKTIRGMEKKVSKCQGRRGDKYIANSTPNPSKNEHAQNFSKRMRRDDTQREREREFYQAHIGLIS